MDLPKLVIKSVGPVTEVWLDGQKISDFAHSLTIRMGEGLTTLELNVAVGSVEVETPIGRLDLNAEVMVGLDNRAFDKAILEAIERARRRGQLKGL